MHTGYKGRTAVFEILTLNNDIKQAFRNGLTGNKLQEVIDNNGFKSMKQDAMRLVLDGTTTASEVARVLHTTD